MGRVISSLEKSLFFTWEGSSSTAKVLFLLEFFRLCAFCLKHGEKPGGKVRMDKNGMLSGPGRGLTFSCVSSSIINHQSSSSPSSSSIIIVIIIIIIYR
jgi:hypothetical protein